MKKKIVLAVFAALAAQSAIAGSQQQSNGFIADSSLDVLLRNAVINRNYKDEGVRTRREWGQAFIATYSSGFTQGPVGFGLDALGQYAVRLDGGRGRSGAGGIDFFAQDENGRAKSSIAKLGGTAKMRFSDTVLSWGTQSPNLPVAAADHGRLLYETFTGFMIDSKEIEGLDITAGYFTAEQQKSDRYTDSGLSRFTFGGARYQFNEQFSASAYASNVEDVINKQYLGFTFSQPLAEKQSLTLDFNGYNSRLSQDYANSLSTGQDNTIWSLAANYNIDIHTFKLAYQQNTGSTGYHYAGLRKNNGVGDSGGSIWLANSYWSDFNAEDERSWQVGYSLDLAGLGVPGLSYDAAYVRGDNIKTSATSNGHEHEFFNQIQYQVPAGVAKDLKLKLRYSTLRVSADASDYNVGGEEVRFYIEYPFSLL